MSLSHRELEFVVDFRSIRKQLARSVPETNEGTYNVKDNRFNLLYNSCCTISRHQKMMDRSRDDNFLETDDGFQCRRLEFFNNICLDDRGSDDY